MSTSLLYHGFGLREVEYQKTVYQQGRVVFHIQPQDQAVKCPTCHSREIRHEGRRSGPFATCPSGESGWRWSVPCREWSATIAGNCARFAFPSRISTSATTRRYNQALERYALELCRVMTLQDVAAHLEMSWDTVKDMEKGRLQRRYGRPKLKRVRRLAIDEIAVRKGHVYLMVVLDLESGAVLFVGHGKGKKALLPFWKRLRGSGAKIQAVAIDMSPAYEAAVRENLSQAALVYDRFHVVKLFNHMLSELRREPYSRHKDQTVRDLLKGTRWLLLKDPENLRKDQDEKKRLEEALKINQTLATAYYLKELFREAFWNCRNQREAARFLDHWLAAAQASGIRLVIGLALTLERHRQGLLNYYRFPISTGPLEGVNNKIKNLKRQAYGYRDPEFFKLKILALHQCKYSLVG